MNEGNGEYGEMREEMGMGYFKVLSQILVGGIEEDHDKPVWVSGQDLKLPPESELGEYHCENSYSESDYGCGLFEGTVAAFCWRK